MRTVAGGKEGIKTGHWPVFQDKQERSTVAYIGTDAEVLNP